MLATLTDSAALPALVERLEPRELKRLVDEVGLEDAGALVACANSTQLAYLVDESIWASTSPGNPETLSAAELLRWFDLWLDMGDGFIAEKLLELGEGFCALVFSRLITVGGVDVDELSMPIGGHLVRSRFDDQWDTLQAALVALWDDDPDFLEALLGRLSFRHSILGIDGEDDIERVLEADASHERESRKERAGFVGSTTAGAFLREIAAADLDALVGERVYDAFTADYFNRRRRDIDDRPAAAAAEADRTVAAGRAPRISEAELDDLQRELEQYEILQSEQVARLTGPGESSGERVLPIRRALAALAAEPDRFEARAGELAYLSNLVMGGVKAGDEQLSETEAANVVMASCNLGASYALWVQAREEEEDADHNPFADMLAVEPGLVRLFRIGWNLTNHLPLQAARRLTQTLSSDESMLRLSSRPWVVGEVAALLNQPSLTETVRARDFDQAQETVKVLAIALEPGAVGVLCLLIDALPRLARALEAEPVQQQPSATVSSSARYISSMKDLVLIERFLGGLQSQLCV